MFECLGAGKARKKQLERCAECHSGFEPQFALETSQPVIESYRKAYETTSVG